MKYEYIKNNKLKNLLIEFQKLDDKCRDMSSCGSGGIYIIERGNIYSLINDIMIEQHNNMRKIYFPHAMLTYFPRHPTFEKRCYDIFQQKVDEGFLPKNSELINPNSEEYRWKDSQTDMNISENWGLGFSWKHFAKSMKHYCSLVYNSDGIIYAPVFDYNNRKNAKVKYIRKIKRGTKTEISYSTKLGIPVLTFSKPDKELLPTDISIPRYMIKIDRGLTFEKYQPYYILNDNRIDIPIKYPDETEYRYNSPWPFDMYINTRTGEIHENPSDYIETPEYMIFEPWINSEGEENNG